MNGGNPSATPNFDNLLIQSLTGRLRTRAPPFHAPPFVADKSFEDLFSDLLLNLSDSESESEITDNPSSSSKTQLANEEAKLEKEIIRIILSGEIEKMNPNSGQAVTIGGHHICVGFHEETDSDYRVWEWHGHIMLFDEENGYTPEYIYGNYVEKVVVGKMKVKKTNMVSDDIDKEVEEKLGNIGLKELIESVDLGSSRVLHRNLNASSGSPRFYVHKMPLVSVYLKDEIQIASHSLDAGTVRCLMVLQNYCHMQAAGHTLFIISFIANTK